MSFSREQIDQLQRIVRDRREALATEILDEVAKSRDDTYANLAGPVTDTGDEAVADLIADLDNAEISRDLQEISELEAARDRIAAGTYGVCADCGNAIDFARLRVQPAALRCVHCQRVHEKTFAHANEPKL